MLDTEPLLRTSDFPRLKREALTTLQVNLGYLCNLSCTHCHVNAGPKRTELMSAATIEQLLQFIDAQGIERLDLTGGAPEMNPHFRYLVQAARERGVEVIDRCNLTILLEPGYEDLADFLAEQEVSVSASLPCYDAQNVDEQRGKGVYEQSIAALQRLNALGYGRHLPLDLVYNPNGAFLPPPQPSLEADFKSQLGDKYGIVFNQLLTITNMPISRFGGMLLSKGLFEEYMVLLKGSHSTENLSDVMCRSLISVDWQGYVYDCDFNQMLNWPLHFHHDTHSSGVIGRDRIHLADLIERSMEGQSIVTGEHCYGCTAGQGSSCSGALS